MPDELTVEEVTGLLVGGTPAEAPSGSTPSGMGTPVEQPEAEAEESAAAAQLSEAAQGASSDGEDAEHEDPAAEEDGETPDGDDEEETPAEVDLDAIVEHDGVRDTLGNLFKTRQRQVDLDNRASQLKADRREFAQERDRIAAEQAELQQTRQAYLQTIETVQGRLQAQQPEPPDPALQHTDPLEYQRKELEVLKWRSQQQDLEAERLKAQSEFVQQQRKLHGDRLRQEAERLREALPEWQDDKVRAAGQARLATYLTSVGGFTAEEVGQAADHRAIVLAEKARKYDELMSNSKVSVAAKVQRAQPTIKQARTVKRKPATEAQKAEAALTKLGTVDAAVDLLLERKGQR